MVNSHKALMINYLGTLGYRLLLFVVEVKAFTVVPIVLSILMRVIRLTFVMGGAPGRVPLKLAQ